MGEKTKEGVTESEFYMWRAAFAFSLHDKILSLEEQKLLQPYSDIVMFSQAQNNTLRNDFKNPQDVEALYHQITNPKDKARFCVLARALAWSNGDIDKQEEAILKKLSCLAKNANDDVLVRTRRHPHVHAYYQQYAKAGVMGLFKAQVSNDL